MYNQTLVIFQDPFLNFIWKTFESDSGKEIISLIFMKDFSEETMKF